MIVCLRRTDKSVRLRSVICTNRNVRPMETRLVRGVTRNVATVETLPRSLFEGERALAIGTSIRLYD